MIFATNSTRTPPAVAWAAVDCLTSARKPLQAATASVVTPHLVISLEESGQGARITQPLQRSGDRAPMVSGGRRTPDQMVDLGGGL